MYFGFKTGEDEEDMNGIKDNFNLNFKSLFNKGRSSLTLEPNTNNTVKLSRISKKIKVDAYFSEMNNPLTLQSVKVYSKDASSKKFPNEPFVSVKNIKINSTPEMTFQKFPLPAIKSTGLKINSLTGLDSETIVNRSNAALDKLKRIIT